MPLELLERDPILAGIMPGHGNPGEPGGSEVESEEETEDDEEPEGDPS